MSSPYELLSTYELLGIPDNVTGYFVIASFIAIFLPYFADLDFGIIKIPKIANKKLFIILGPLFMLISLGGFYQLWDHPSMPATSAKWAQYTPIENIESLSKSFVVRTSPPPVLKLRFEANRWPVAFTFRVASDLPLAELKEAILAHFGFAEHVSFDLSGFPIDGTWFPDWVLTINGHIIETYDPLGLQLPTTLAAAGVRNSDILRLRLVWTGGQHVALHVGRAKKKLIFPPYLDY